MITAQEQAIAVGRMLLDTASIEAALPERSRASLADGLAGTALLHARLSGTDPAFAAAAARHWDRAAQLIRQSRGSAPEPSPTGAGSPLP